MPRLMLALGCMWLCLALAGCGKSSDATAVPFQEQVAKAQKEPDAELRAKRLVRIGYQQGKALDKAGAEATLRLAAKDCAQIDDLAGRATVLAMLSEAYSAIGANSAAGRAATDALDAAAKVKSAERKGRALARIAQAQAAADSTAAVATLQAAEKLAAEVKEVEGRMLVYVAVAGGYQKLAQANQRDRVFATALDFANSVDDMKKRSLAIAEVAAKQAELNLRKAAEDNFTLAVKAAEKIEKPYFRAYAMSELAERLSKAGFHSEARKLLSQAETVAEKVAEPDMQAQALQKIRALMGNLPHGEG